MSYGGSCFRSYINRFISADTIVPNPANPQSFNRYSYGHNNPVKYIDPTGHISCTDSNLPLDDQQSCQGQANNSQLPTQDITYTLAQVPFTPTDQEDNRIAELIPVVCGPGGCAFVDFLFPLYLAKPGATPGAYRTPGWQKLGKSLSSAGAAVDMFSTAISSTGVLLQLTAAGVGGPIGPDDVLAHLSYYLLDPLENAVSWVGAGFAVAGDFAAGGSNIDFQSREVIIGQDTTVLVVAGQIGQISGAFPVAGPSFDTVINLAVNVYDIGRLSGSIPTVVEIRWDSTGPYAIFYAP